MQHASLIPYFTQSQNALRYRIVRPSNNLVPSESRAPAAPAPRPVGNKKKGGANLTPGWRMAQKGDPGMALLIVPGQQAASPGECALRLAMRISEGRQWRRRSHPVRAVASLNKENAEKGREGQEQTVRE